MKLKQELEEKLKLKNIIAYLENTKDDEWNLGYVRSKDSKQNCFFGHLFNMGKNQEESNIIWNEFEERYATTYMIYPVNDGINPKYKQTTPKARVLAYLRNIESGAEKTTYELMEECSQRIRS